MILLTLAVSVPGVARSRADRAAQKNAKRVAKRNAKQVKRDRKMSQKATKDWRKQHKPLF
jgi:hypothetical protein